MELDEPALIEDDVAEIVGEPVVDEATEIVPVSRFAPAIHLIVVPDIGAAKCAAYSELDEVVAELRKVYFTSREGEIAQAFVIGADGIRYEITTQGFLVTPFGDYSLRSNPTPVEDQVDDAGYLTAGGKHWANLAHGAQQKPQLSQSSDSDLYYDDDDLPDLD